MKNKIMWGIFTLSEAGSEYVHAAHWNRKCAKLMADDMDKCKGYPKVKKIVVTEYVKDNGIVE